MWNLSTVRNGSAASAEKATFQIHTWFPYYRFCRDGHTASTHMVSLLQFLQGKPHYKYTSYFCITVYTDRTTMQISRGFLSTVSTGRTTLQVHAWFPYYRFCRENHTASTRVISLLPFLQGESHCKYKRDFLTTVSAGRTTLQAHLWILYYRGGCEGSLIDTHLTDKCIMRENLYALFGASCFPFKFTIGLKGCPVTISTLNWELFCLLLSRYLTR